MLRRYSKKMVYEEYSENRECRFQIYKNKKYYEVCVESRLTDDYEGNVYVYYCDVDHYKHIADSLKRAIEIGRECINNHA